MLFRSLRSLTGRALAAGAASALTLTLFNAAQPTLGNHQVQPGTLNDVKIALTPAPAPTTARAATAAAPAAGARLQSPPVDVGKARFVGFSWPDADPTTEDQTVWMRSRDAGGWSDWREVEQAGDGPDANSREYRAASRPTATGSGSAPGPTRSRSGSTRRPGPGRGGPRPRRWPRVGWRPT